MVSRADPHRRALVERHHPFSRIVAEALSILRLRMHEDKRVDLVQDKSLEVLVGATGAIS